MRSKASKPTAKNKNFSSVFHESALHPLIGAGTTDGAPPNICSTRRGQNLDKRSTSSEFSILVLGEPTSVPVDPKPLGPSSSRPDVSKLGSTSRNFTSINKACHSQCLPLPNPWLYVSLCCQGHKTFGLHSQGRMELRDSWYSSYSLSSQLGELLPGTRINVDKPVHVTYVIISTIYRLL